MDNRKEEGELVRFSGKIKGGGTGLVVVTKINKSFSDLAKYDEYAKSTILETVKDSTVEDLKGFLFANNAGKQGRFITLNYKVGETVTCILHYFVPSGKNSYSIVCTCDGKDLNSIFKTYMEMMLSLKV